jgi:hypothetical protein
MSIQGQDDDDEKNGTGSESEHEQPGNDEAAAPGVEKGTAEAHLEDEAGGEKKPDGAKPGADKPAADGKKKGAEGEPESTEQAIRKALELEKPDEKGAKKKEVVKDGKKPDGEKTPEGEKKVEKKIDLYAEPEGLQEKSKDRFQKLVTSHKEQATQIEGMGQTIAGFREMVKSTGATEPQFVEALDMLTLINKNPAEAAKKLYEAAVNLAVQHNVEIAGVDFLKEFSDLQQQVEDRQITAEAAREIAKGRREEKARKDREAEDGRRNEYLRAQKEQQQQVLTSIETFLAERETNDIDWKAKAPMLLKAAEFARKTLPLGSWLPYLQQQYEQIGEIVAKANPPANNSGGNRPLRPNAGAGGQEQPKDMLGAIRQGLGI